MIVELRFNGRFIGQVFGNDIRNAMTYKTDNGDYVLKLNEIMFIIDRCTVQKNDYGYVYTIHIKY